MPVIWWHGRTVSSSFILTPDSGSMPTGRVEAQSRPRSPSSSHTSPKSRLPLARSCGCNEETKANPIRKIFVHLFSINMSCDTIPHSSQLYIICSYQGLSVGFTFPPALWQTTAGFGTPTPAWTLPWPGHVHTSGGTLSSGVTVSSWGLRRRVLLRFLDLFHGIITISHICHIICRFYSYRLLPALVLSWYLVDKHPAVLLTTLDTVTSPQTAHGSGPTWRATSASLPSCLTLFDLITPTPPPFMWPVICLMLLVSFLDDYTPLVFRHTTYHMRKLKATSGFGR